MFKLIRRMGSAEIKQYLLKPICILTGCLTLFF